jgi:mRNA interferase MazF
VNQLATPSRGEIWLVDLEPTQGREQKGTRPALILSTDRFNSGPAELVVVLALTKVSRGIPSHILIARSDSGLDYDSYIISEQVRCVSKVRLARKIGHAPRAVIERVSQVLRVLLEL